jgi:hypothetical protein
MLSLIKHLLELWLPLGGWQSAAIGGPYEVVAGQCYAAGASGGQVTE